MNDQSLEQQMQIMLDERQLACHDYIIKALLAKIEYLENEIDKLKDKEFTKE